MNWALFCLICQSENKKNKLFLIFVPWKVRCLNRVVHNFLFFRSSFMFLRRFLKIYQTYTVADKLSALFTKVI